MQTPLSEERQQRIKDEIDEVIKGDKFIGEIPTNIKTEDEKKYAIKYFLHQIIDRF